MFDHHNLFKHNCNNLIYNLFRQVVESEVRPVDIFPYITEMDSKPFSRNVAQRLV